MWWSSSHHCGVGIQYLCMRTPCFFSFSTCGVKQRSRKTLQKKPTRKLAPQIGSLAVICSLGNQQIEPLVAHSFRKDCKLYFYCFAQIKFTLMCSTYLSGLGGWSIFQVHLWKWWKYTAWSGIILQVREQRSKTDVRREILRHIRTQESTSKTIVWPR